jgi:hypothetical protein
VRHPGFAFLIELALFVLFGLFATYAFSAAGLVPAMPWRAPALALIAVVYLLRGTLVVFQLRGQLPLSRPRDIAYSVFALIIGVAYAVPTWRSWSHFSS